MVEIGETGGDTGVMGLSFVPCCESQYILEGREDLRCFGAVL